MVQSVLQTLIQNIQPRHHTTLGLVKIGYSENGKNYPVELSSGQDVC